MFRFEFILCATNLIFLDFNTSYVSVRVYLQAGPQILKQNFNTSYVSVRVDAIIKKNIAIGFQYIICFGSRMAMAAIELTSTYFNTSYVSVRANFKPSITNSIPDFNTSYVSVRVDFSVFDI